MPHEPRFVLAEDDDVHARLLSRAVERRGGARLERVSDGVELLDYLENCTGPDRPDIILMDLKMPRRNGLEVLRDLKADDRFRRLPVVIVTTSDAPADRASAYNLGASAFVTKPIGFRQFGEMVEAILSFWADWNEPPPPLAGGKGGDPGAERPVDMA